MGWVRRLRNLVRGGSLDHDIDRELRFHIAERIDELMASGMTEEEARLAATRAFGNHSLQKERTREANVLGWLESIGRDLRYGVRMIGKSPVFAVVVVLSLSIGIAANATLFSIIDAMLLRKMPVDRPGEIVYFKWAARSNWLAMSIVGTSNTDRDTGETTCTSFSYATFQRFREASQTLSDVFAYVPFNDFVTVTPVAQVVATRERGEVDGVDAQSSLASAQLVSGNYFSSLRAPALMGRTFTDEDDRQASPVVVITYRYWERGFNKQPDVIGKEIMLNGILMTIVGVTGPGFVGAQGFAGETDISVPLGLHTKLLGQNRSNEPWRWWVVMMGRLRPGASALQARSELEPLFHSSALEAWSAAPAQSRARRDRTAEMPRLLVLDGSRGVEDNVSDASKILAPLIGIAVILLFIVCINVANLLLARTAERQSELSVRMALGGSRSRVVRQLVTEIVLLSVTAGLLSVPLTRWTQGLIVGLFPAIDYDLRVDARMLAFTVLLAVSLAVLMGLAPALRATRRNISPSLQEKSRSVTGPKTRLSKALLVTQVVLSVVLLAGAGLFVRTVANLRSVDFGFDTHNILLFRVNPGSIQYDDIRTESFYSEALDRVAALPGVNGATLSRYALVGNSGTRDSLYYKDLQNSLQNIEVDILRVHPNFFRVVDIPLLAGREFDARDMRGGPPVAIINETLSRRMFGDGNPVGARFGIGRPEHNGEVEVIGVTKDISIRDARAAVPPAIYLPDTQGTPTSATFIIRTSAPPYTLVAPIRETVRQIEPNIPTLGFRTQAEAIDEAFTIERVFAAASAFFGIVALVLACIGLFGLMSYTVGRRTNEIGIRMALGATRRHVVRMVMLQTAVIVLIGVIIGFCASFGAGKGLSSMRILFKVSPYDPLSLGLAVTAIIGVAFLASYIPARRASRVDPSIALRIE